MYAVEGAQPSLRVASSFNACAGGQLLQPRAQFRLVRVLVAGSRFLQAADEGRNCVALARAISVSANWILASIRRGPWTASSSMASLAIARNIVSASACRPCAATALPEQEPSAAGFEIAGNRSTEMPNLSCSEVNHRGHDLRYYVPCPIE